MENRLDIFINAIETLWQQINNIDKTSIYLCEWVIDNKKYWVAASKDDPTYMGFANDGIWVVIDPSHKYYKHALKLKREGDPDYLTDLQPINIYFNPNTNKLIGIPAQANPNTDTYITTLYWYIVKQYEELFTKPIHFFNSYELKGDKGDKGDNSELPDIEELVIDFNNIKYNLSIEGPSIVTSNAEFQYYVVCNNEILPIQITIDTNEYPVISLHSDNVLHTETLTVSKNITLSSSAYNMNVSKVIEVRASDLMFKLVSIRIEIVTKQVQIGNSTIVRFFGTYSNTVEEYEEKLNPALLQLSVDSNSAWFIYEDNELKLRVSETAVSGQNIMIHAIRGNVSASDYITVV